MKTIIQEIFSKVRGILEWVRVRVRKRRVLGRYHKLKTTLEPNELANAHQSYWEKCQSSYQESEVSFDPAMVARAREFHRKGFTSIWTDESEALANNLFQKLQEEEKKGKEVWVDAVLKDEGYQAYPEFEKLLRGPLGKFLYASFRSHFRIYYMKVFRSERLLDYPTGSQLWHTDGGPGTCINVLWYLTTTQKEHGALECLDWKETSSIIKKAVFDGRYEKRLREEKESRGSLSRDEEREVKVRLYEELLNEKGCKKYQPVGNPGTLVAFRNNLLHKGGFPETGFTRYAAVFHCYPSLYPPEYEDYAKRGLPKRGPYPFDPAEQF